MANWTSMIEYVHAVAAVLGLALNVLAQLVACRWAKQLSLMRSVYLGFVAGLLGLALLEGLYVLAVPQSRADALSRAALNVATYFALGYGYFIFVTLGETGRRIRIVRELHDAGRPLTQQEIVARYNAQSIVNVRIERLLGTGQIAFRDGRYYLRKRTVLTIARMVVLMKQLVLGKRSEFE